ncbi:MAG: NAD-dependent epimerase/dehydratase family protein [Candidatus Aenigmarchaeota archaeon]|nr:NAD-dependent epimerase/dehydratase family protein [Candidatus Aenigmarchaeota archaeon]
MKNFVTGATGFVGGNLVKELVDRGEDVVALVRRNSDTSKIKDLGVEFCEGDVLDKDSIMKAMKGCDMVFHSAALFVKKLRDTEQFYKVNVDGTKNVLSAALKLKVSKVVHTSTAATTGVPESGMANENTAFNKWDFSNDYTKSKYLGEKVAFEYASKGLPVVIVNPVAPIGAGDVKPTPTGQHIVSFVRGNVKYSMNGINHYTYVGDVVKGHILAAEKGNVGQRYILGGHNIRAKNFLKLLEEVTGASSEKVRMLPYWALVPAGYGISVLSKIRRKKSNLSDAVRYSRSTPFYDFSKSVNELGLPQTPLRIAVEEAFEWFKENNYV